MPARQMTTARRQILRAASELFTDRGFHATSMRDIGDQLGIGQSALYYHAKNKAQILVDINQQLLEELLADTEEIAATECTGFEKLSLVVHALLRKTSENKAAVTVVLHERRSLPAHAAESLKTMRDQVDAAIDRILQQGIDDGTIRPLPVSIIRLATNGMANWAYTWYDPNGPFRAVEIADAFLDILHAGVRGPAAS